MWPMPGVANSTTKWPHLSARERAMPFRLSKPMLVRPPPERHEALRCAGDAYAWGRGRVKGAGREAGRRASARAGGQHLGGGRLGRLAGIEVGQVRRHPAGETVERA